MTWYANELLLHGQRLCQLASSIFNTSRPRSCTLAYQALHPLSPLDMTSSRLSCSMVPRSVPTSNATHSQSPATPAVRLAAVPVTASDQSAAACSVARAAETPLNTSAAGSMAALRGASDQASVTTTTASVTQSAAIAKPAAAQEAAAVHPGRSPTQRSLAQPAQGISSFRHKTLGLSTVPSNSRTTDDTRYADHHAGPCTDENVDPSNVNCQMQHAESSSQRPAVYSHKRDAWNGLNGEHSNTVLSRTDWQGQAGLQQQQAAGQGSAAADASAHVDSAVPSSSTRAATDVQTHSHSRSASCSHLSS